MRLQAVLFDMGGTLDDYHYDRASALAALPDLRKLLARAGGGARGQSSVLMLDDEGLLDLVDQGEVAYRCVREKNLVESPADLVWRDFYLKGRGAFPGLDPELGEELAFLVDTRFYLRSLRPEAPSVLEALKARGLKLAIVSNVLSRGQVPSDLARYGIDGLFDAVLTSSEFGRRKPDPAIFLRAADLVGARPENCAFVGDRVSRDIAGAKGALFALAVLLRNPLVADSEPAKPEPDFAIDSLDELIPGLESFETGESI
jgi:putative hydrolase of the HAD superfamily